MCSKCDVPDFCFCGTSVQPLPDKQRCGCRAGDSCDYCGHRAGTGRPIPTDVASDYEEYA